MFFTFAVRSAVVCPECTASEDGKHDRPDRNERAAQQLGAGNGLAQDRPRQQDHEHYAELIDRCDP